MNTAQREMRQNKTDRFISEYCQAKGIRLLIDPELDRNDGLSYPSCKEVHLAQSYSSRNIKLAVFCHEIGHCVVNRFKHQPYNIFEEEMAAWNEGMKLYKKHFGRSFSKQQAEFMLKCLKTYCRSQYEFKKTHCPKDE